MWAEKTLRRPGPAARASDVGTGGEIRALTGLRLVAAAWVLLFHFSVTPGTVVGAVLAPLAPVLDTGPLGVDLFFVLSGFVIGLTYLDRLGAGLRLRPATRFLWAGLCRIWPVYAVVTTLFALLSCWPGCTRARRGGRRSPSAAGRSRCP